MDKSNTVAAYGCLFSVLIITGIILLFNDNNWGYLFIIGGVVVWGVGAAKKNSDTPSNEGLSGYGTVDETATLANYNKKNSSTPAEIIDFDEISPEEDEIEYCIVGINFRNLSAKDVGYSDSFSIKADTENSHDKYAVEIYNARGSFAGYLEQPDNEFWFKFLTKAKKGAPWMHCRGYIGIFKNERDEYKYYGKVYLPEIEQDEQYHEIMK